MNFKASVTIETIIYDVEDEEEAMVAFRDYFYDKRTFYWREQDGEVMLEETEEEYA